MEKDAALERRFQPIKVEEPTPEQTLGILSGLSGTYEEHHEVRVELKVDTLLPTLSQCVRHGDVVQEK